MFSALLTPLASLWVTGLLILWAMLLFGGFIFARANTGRTGRMPLWTRLASSVVLVVAAWSWYLVSRGTTTSLFALLIAIGMTLGLVGDLFMARLLAVAQYVLLGMAAFGWAMRPTSPPGWCTATSTVWQRQARVTAYGRSGWW